MVDAYALAFASLLLSTGTLGDRIGARRMFILGLAIFTTASLLCGVAPGPAALIAARVLQGAGAAALVPSSLALLNLACGDDPRLRAWGIGWWTAAGSVGLAAGPLLGDVLVDLLGWRSIFLVNLPIGLIGIRLTQRCVGASPRSETRIDWSGQALAIATLLCLTASVIEAHGFGWSSPVIRAGLLIAATGAASLVGIGPATGYGAIFIGLVLMPAGIGVTVPVMTASLLACVPQTRAGMASGVLNAMSQAGGAVGVGLFGGLAATSIRDVFLLTTAILIAAAVTATCLVRGTKVSQQPVGKMPCPGPVPR